MTTTTQTIFEKYEIRKTRKQKDAFTKWVVETARTAGYEAAVEKGLLGARNIVIGDPEKAKVIYTAHYDTCAVLPFPNFITPKNRFLYLLYQLAVSFIVLAVFYAVMFLLYVLNVPNAILLAELLLLTLLVLMLFGPANKHTANDNTSGVTTVLDIMNKLPADTNDNTAFVLFDLEEAGLFESLSYRLKHNKMMQDKLLINFDCVSDGKNVLIKTKKRANKFVPLLEECFKGNEDFSVEVATRGVTYPSDQEMFPCGVGVAALKRSRTLKILYMNRIHTKHDTVYQEENIDFLANAAIKLSVSIREHNNKHAEKCE